jgi:hypothetical protein
MIVAALSSATVLSFLWQGAAFAITVVVVGGVAVLLLALRPYVPAKAWKFPVKLLLLLVTLLNR